MTSWAFGWVSEAIQAIICTLQNLAYSVIAAIVLAVNALIVGLAAAAEAVDVIPMPDEPTVPAVVTEYLGWGAWFFPVATVVAIVTWAAVVWLAWFGISILLRWAKAI